MELLKVDEAAKLTKLGKSTVYLMISRGELPAIRFGKAVRIPQEALENYIRQRTQVPA